MTKHLTLPQVQLNDVEIRSVEWRGPTIAFERVERELEGRWVDVAPAAWAAVAEIEAGGSFVTADWNLDADFRLTVETGELEFTRLLITELKVAA